MCERRVNLLVYSLSLHRHSYIGFILAFASSIHNKQQPWLTTPNEAAADKIQKYRSDYNNTPPSTVAFIPGMTSTSGRLHSEFIRPLFLQTHRETDHFFPTSGVQLPESTIRLSISTVRRSRPT